MMQEQLMVLGVLNHHLGQAADLEHHLLFGIHVLAQLLTEYFQARLQLLAANAFQQTQRQIPHIPKQLFMFFVNRGNTRRKLRIPTRSHSYLC